MIRRPPRSTRVRSSAASDVYKRQGFLGEGDVIFFLGDAPPVLDGSEYQKRWFGRVEGRIPDVDLEAEVLLQGVLRRAIADGMIRSAHDCSDGGLGVCLAECCLAAGIGARVDLHGLPGLDLTRSDITLFGETPTRVVVSVDSGVAKGFRSLCAGAELPCRDIGRVSGDALAIRVGAEEIDVPLPALREAHGRGLQRSLGE